MTVGTQLFHVSAHVHTKALRRRQPSCSTHGETECFFFLQRTDGCQEYLLPQNDTVLINLTHRVTELTPQALLLYSDAKSDLWNLKCD